MENLTIVSSCGGAYSRYLSEWAESIARLDCKPGAVCLYTHGDEASQRAGLAAIAFLDAAGIVARWEHSAALLDFGTARNRAVAMSSTEWVMHLDCDDQIMPHCLTDVAAIAPNADVVALGYERSGDLKSGPSNRYRLYSDTTGLKALDAAAPCSGVSPFRRSFWERSPYRTDMVGAWDTALWIGFARLGARFRATRRPEFWYRQHADSIFNRRRTTFDWVHARTVSMLKSLRRGDQGVAVIVPLDANIGRDRDRRDAWAFVRAHYERNHPTWTIIEGVARGPHWRKGEAVRDALSRCKASILVVADADCIVAPAAMIAAVERVASGASPWAVPHDRVLRLNAETTRDVLGGDDPAIDESRDLARRPYQGYAGGGILVVPRVGFDATGGIPESFKGWGGEDQALAVILDTCLGVHWRGAADLVHLWHEPQQSKRMGGATNQIMYRAIANAAALGPDGVLSAIRSGPSGDGRPVPPWKRKAMENAAAAPLSRKERQNFLARRNRGANG